MRICLMAAVLVMATGQGFGETEFKDGGTHNIDYTINDDVWVDYLAPGMQTTVNLLNGGSIPSPYDFRGYNDSRINISGGTVGYWVIALQRSQLTMSGGTVGDCLAALESSQVTMSGGTVAHLTGQQSGKINWSGGTIKSYLLLDDSANLIINGSDFAIGGSPVGFGEKITSILGGSAVYEPWRHLTGTLANGDIINNNFLIGFDASIVLVPEPATLLLLGLGGLMLRKWRLVN